MDDYQPGPASIFSAHARGGMAAPTAVAVCPYCLGENVTVIDIDGKTFNFCKTCETVFPCKEPAA